MTLTIHKPMRFYPDGRCYRIPAKAINEGDLEIKLWIIDARPVELRLLSEIADLKRRQMEGEE
jgi:hypothetical protein